MFKVKKVIDISRKICMELTLWPGDTEVKISRISSISEGDECNLSSIEMGLHIGTHVDAPFHFMENGNAVQNLDLSRFVGKVKVFELSVKKCITKEDIAQLDIQEEDAVFFKTSNSHIPEDTGFYSEYIYIDAAAAQYLADKGIKALGIDYLSVDAFNSKDNPAHCIFLSRNIGIIENLNLKNVKPGEYFFVCLPLNIEGVEGSPARTVLLEFE